MITNDWSLVVTDSFQNLWAGMLNFVPSIVVAILIILIGWLVGILIGRLVQQIISGIKLDSALKKAGLDDLLRKGDIALDSGAFIGGLVKWFVIVAFLIAAFDVLGLTSITAFLQDVVAFIPQVIVAALILLFAGVLGDVVSKIVVSSSKAAGFKMTGFLSSLTKWSIWIFAILVALEQLGIGVQFIGTLFMGTVGALAIALGLSFGLGGKEVAGKIVAKAYDDLSK